MRPRLWPEEADGADRLALFREPYAVQAGGVAGGGGPQVEGDGTVTVTVALWVAHDGNARATLVVFPPWLRRVYAQRRQHCRSRASCRHLRRAGRCSLMKPTKRLTRAVTVMA